jgi:hypothetical protein
MSKRSGFAKRRSSRFAAPRKHMTSASGGNTPPETRTSVLVRRGTMCVGAV